MVMAHGPPRWLSFVVGHQHCLKGAISASVLWGQEMLLARITPPDPIDLPGCVPGSSFMGAGLSTPSNVTSQGVSAAHSCSSWSGFPSVLDEVAGRGTLCVTVKLPAQYVECFKTNFPLWVSRYKLIKSQNNPLR